ncbi:MAG: hypothetical protein ACREUU_04985, partial [Gammaproteobacteria bacterium]
DLYRMALVRAAWGMPEVRRPSDPWRFPRRAEIRGGFARNHRTMTKPFDAAVAHRMQLWLASEIVECSPLMRG